jgi:hypothetical protein
MRTLRYTLIADGSSDKVLLRIIKWSLDNIYPKMATEQNFADFRSFPNPPKTVEQKVKQAKDYFPYDILFIHRDAEKNDNAMVDRRIEEIKREIGIEEFERTVCIIPVRMMEAWLLINEDAIMKAAGNRSYNQPMNLPAPKALDREKKPKEVLHTLLRNASGLKGRRLSTFNSNYAVHLVAEYIDDYSPLRQLQAFNAFELELKQKIDKYLLKA